MSAEMPEMLGIFQIVTCSLFKIEILPGNWPLICQNLYFKLIDYSNLTSCPAAIRSQVFTLVIYLIVQSKKDSYR